MSGDDHRSRPGEPIDESELPALPLEGEDPEELVGEPLPAVLGDRYETLSRLGKGACGEVFRARDRVLGREVAVKRIRLDTFVEPEQLERVKQRFLREAQVAAQLSHPGIVTTHDIVSGPTTSFIVMELVRGDTLQTVLQGRRRLSLAETLEILEQVSTALDHAHLAGIIHRDVKPANIMLQPSGQVKVMDFGIAKLDSGANLTSTGLILGTPNYMSPEQARGQKVDARADVFSLGCVLYECVTGAKPFPGETIAAILARILTEPPPSLDAEALGLPPALDQVLKHAMAREPSRRYSSAGELMRAIRQAAERGTAAPPAAVAEGSGTVVTRAAPAPASSPPPRRRQRPLVAAGLIAAALLAVAVGVQALRSGVASPPPAETGALVSEEEVGFFGRVLGREPRLFITVPAATALRVELRTPVGSALSSPGDEFAGEVRRAVEVEGVEAVKVGARVSGHVASVTPAEEAGGRGALTLAFDEIVLVDGRELEIEAAPVVLRAPEPRRKKKGLIAGITDAGAVIGGFFGSRKEEAIGGAAGADIVYSERGADVELTAGSSLEVQLAAPAGHHPRPGASVSGSENAVSPRSLSPFGGVVDGLDLSATLAPEVSFEIAARAHVEGVLLFRDQNLDEAQQVAFSRGLGELEIHPEKLKQKASHPEIFNLSNVRDNGRLEDPLGTATERWHTDSSYREIPCTLSILYALEVPPRGGDTEFANACRAWERFPADRQAQLEGLRVVHSYQYSSPDAWAMMSEAERAAVPPVEHPLVRCLADGRRGLYLGSHASHVVGLPLEEGRALLRELLEHATADGTYRHRWRPGDLLIWDNRVTLHRRRPYRQDADRRVMRRTTVRGSERP